MTPYRSDCRRCVELQRDLEISKQLVDALRKDRWYDSSKTVGMISLMLFVATGIGFAIHGAIVAPPSPPGPCVDSAEIIGPGNSVRECSIGARMTTEFVNHSDNVIVHCRCGADAQTIDAGAE